MRVVINFLHALLKIILSLYVRTQFVTFRVYLIKYLLLQPDVLCY